MEETPVPPRVSVLIISHNSAPFLRRCLAALEGSTDRDKIEIIVVDCGSWDESPSLDSEFPAVIFQRLPKDFGITKALNIGMRTGKGDFVLFLDPRVEVRPDTIPALAAALESAPDAVAVCPLLATPEGAPVPQLAKLPTAESIAELASQPGWSFTPADPGASEARAVEFPSFDALMARLYFLKGLRFIDERYGDSWADAEIAYQIRRAGKRILMIPSASASLQPEGELQRTSNRDRALLDADWTSGAAAFASKHFGVASGLKIRVAAIVRALGSVLLGILSPGEMGYRFSRLVFLISGQKIDGTQA